MGIKFFAPQAPEREVEVDYGDGDVAVELTSTLPVVALSNATAASVMRLLGMPDAPAGICDGADLDTVIQKALWLLNTGRVQAEVVPPTASVGARRVHVRDDGVPEIGRAATFISAGVPEERILRRLQDLLDLFTQARQHGYEVHWA